MMKQLWKLGLGIFIFASMTTNVWGQRYVGGQQQDSTESFKAWAAEQMQQIQEAVSSLKTQLAGFWSDSRPAGGIQDPTTEPGSQPSVGGGRGQSMGGQQGRMPTRGQNAVDDSFNPGSVTSMGRGAGVRPQGTGRGRGGSARGMGVGRGGLSGGAFPGELQNVPSGSGRGRGTSGLTSMGSGRGRGSGGMGSAIQGSGRGKGRRRK
jgi:hypothetical protein